MYSELKRSNLSQDCIPTWELCEICLRSDVSRKLSKFTKPSDLIVCIKYQYMYSYFLGLDLALAKERLALFYFRTDRFSDAEPLLAEYVARNCKNLLTILQGI